LPWHEFVCSGTLDGLESDLAMQLSLFIRANMREILTEWTAFARKNEPEDGDMTTLALVDHAEAILTAVALDIDTHQTDQEQYQKSQGEDDPVSSSEETAAAIHGRLRHASNFSLLQLSSEFRALRATVLRLWLPHVDAMSQVTIYEMVRFNEAIDQALAESIVTYSARAERTRDLFLAVLGHDLRAPLATISLVASLLKSPSLVEQTGKHADKLQRSAMLMSAMITDLLGYARLQLGGGMPTVRTAVDVREVCEAATADARAMFPGGAIRLDYSGDLMGSFDRVRLQQLVTNLLINAVQYCTKGTEVVLSVFGGPEAIRLLVQNEGPAISEEDLATIFQPLVQLDADLPDDVRPRTSLGLGLFVAKETAEAHGGEIAVSSSAADGTVFEVVFPRP
jgi:signal transduction histidine kinase